MVIMHLYRHLSIALYYISLLFGLGNDDQNRNPNMNNRDHLVGQPTIVTSSNLCKFGFPVVTMNVRPFGICTSQGGSPVKEANYKNDH